MVRLTVRSLVLLNRTPTVSNLRASSPWPEQGIRSDSERPWPSDRFFAQNASKRTEFARPPTRQIGRAGVAA